jgi:hypothetical protein
MTAALVPYYEGKNLLRHVDGVGNPSEVGQRIRRAIVDLTGITTPAASTLGSAGARGGANGS